MNATDTMAQAVDAISAALYERDLPHARRLFDDAVQGRQEVVEPLVRQLAATVTVPPGLVVWGFGLDIWANPYRDVDERAVRCGDCRWTASHYKSDQAAQAAAEQHVAKDHPTQPPTVVSYMDEAYWDAVSTAEARSDMDRKLTPTELAELQAEHSRAVAQQRRDREELAAKQQRDEAWGEEIEQRRDKA